MLKTFAIAFVSIFSLNYSFSINSERDFSLQNNNWHSFHKTADRFINSSTTKLVSSRATTETMNSCPQDIEKLTELLVGDIPDYSNRVIQRTQDIHRDVGIDNYIIIAKQPELEPLNLPQINYGSTDTDTTKQIFFSTLERQYQNQKKIERQTYHWLFVTMTDSGWHLVTMYSRFGHATKNTPPTPPIESSNGIIGKAVSLWLRDCRASFALR